MFMVTERVFTVELVLFKFIPVIKNVPSEFFENLDPANPIILGGVLATESSCAFIQARIKRHRWYKKILKTNDPVIISNGWQRFQTLPIYSLNDGTRNRMLKYTPEHMHCLVNYFGPVSAPNTGFCAFQTISDGKVFKYNFSPLLESLRQGSF